MVELVNMQAVEQHQASTMVIPSSNTSSRDQTATKTHQHIVDGSSGSAAAVTAYERVRHLISSSAVVVFSSSDCCMCHVAKQLLLGLGVAPVVVELRPDDTDRDIIYGALLRFIIMLGGAETVSSSDGDIDKFGGFLPAVFVGGKLVGGIESLMASHINGSLVPRLKDAGALWL